MMKCSLTGVDSGFEIRDDCHGSCRGVWGHAPQENVDFGPLKMAIWESLLLYQLLKTLTIYIYILCIQNTKSFLLELEVILGLMLVF